MSDNLEITIIKEEMDSGEEKANHSIYEENAEIRAKSIDDAIFKASSSINGEIEDKPGAQSILGKPYNCYHCDYSGRSRIDFKIHVAGHVGDVGDYQTMHQRNLKYYACDKCNYKSSFGGNLKRHMLTHTSDKPYSCDSCGFKTKKLYGLKMHIRTHTGERPFACDKCDYTCNRVQHLKRHLRVHSGEKPVACTICNYRGKDSRYLKAHMKTHIRLYTCDRCDYKSIVSEDLEHHAKSHDSPHDLDGIIKDVRKDDLQGVSADGSVQYLDSAGKRQLMLQNRRNRKPFTCHHCNHKARTRGDMKIHLRKHTGEKPYACDLCDYKSSQQGHIRRHMMVHTGEKPYACDVCNYRAQYLTSLRIHKMIHTKEKPLSCHECQYRTITLGSLKLHMRKHTGEKPFTCHKCQYRTTTHGSLKLHMMKHTGEKPYACDKCDYRSARRYRLNLHLRAHQKPIDGCDFKASTVQDLKSHMKTHKEDSGSEQEMTIGGLVIIKEEAMDGDELEHDTSAATTADDTQKDINQGVLQKDCSLQNFIVEPSGLELHRKCPEIGEITAENPQHSITCGRLSGEAHQRMKMEPSGLLQNCIAEPSELGLHQKYPEIEEITAKNPQNSNTCGRLSGEACDRRDFRASTLQDLKCHPKTHEEDSRSEQEVTAGCVMIIKEEAMNGDELEHDSSAATTAGDPDDYQRNEEMKCSVQNCIAEHTEDAIVQHFNCLQCEFRGKTRRGLKRHMKTHAGEEASDRCPNKETSRGMYIGDKYVCDRCDFSTKQVGLLTIHKRVHTGEKPYKCDICDFRTSQLGILKTHKRRHTGEKPYACDHCDSRFSQRDRLRRHKMAHTGEKPYACNICDHRSAALSEMKCHMKTHSGERPYACDICDFRCAKMDGLRNHKRTHTGERPFACTRCVYRATTSGGLRRHMKIHLNQPVIKEEVNNDDLHNSSAPQIVPPVEPQHLKLPNNGINLPLSASAPQTVPADDPQHLKLPDNGINLPSSASAPQTVPADDSSQSATLLESTTMSMECDMKIYSGQKLFACSDCDYKVGRVRDLKIHMRIHTGDKPYACNVCDYRSTTSSHLNRHLKTHSDEKPYACGLCDCRYRAQSALKKHIVRMHNV